MLQFMRKASGTWIMRGFFAILILAFVILWGIGDVWRPGLSNNQTLVSVGKESVSVYGFIKAYQRRMHQYQAQGRERPSENQVKSEVLQSLVFESILNQEANRLGLAISDQELRTLIKNNPAFRDKSGKFNIDVFRAIAQSEGFSEAEFTEEIRGQYRRDQLVRMVTAGLSVPPSYLKTLFKFQNEKRKIDWVFFPFSEVKKVPQPTEEEISAYYESHKQDYIIPENRDFTVLVLNISHLKKQVVLTDQEISEGIAQHRAQVKGTVPTKQETEKVINILKAEKATKEFHQLTTQIEDDIAGGLSLEKIAQEYKLPLVKVDQLQRDGDIEKKPDLSTYALLRIIKAGFQMQEGEEPTYEMLDNGEEMIAFRVDHIREQRQQSLEDVKSKVTKLLKEEKVHDTAKKEAGEIVKAVNSGSSLKKISNTQNLKYTSDVVLERMSQSGEKTVPSIRFVAFQNKIGEAGLAPLSNGYAIVMPVQSIHPQIENRENELKVFKDNLSQAFSSDILQEYWTGLQRFYKIHENPNTWKKIENL